MKFKSNVKVTQEAPVNFEDLMQDMDNVLNMELEEAVEHLEDLTILEQNISKYGVTEPVMHLVGGTLESWSIDISNKEACLEGIGDKLKEAGKKVWEIIVKIYEKIRDYIKGMVAKFNKEKFNELKDKFKGQKVDLNAIDATNLIPANYVKLISEFASDVEKDVGHDAELWARSYPKLFTIADGGVIEVNQEFDAAVRDAKFSTKGYSDLSKMYEISAGFMADMDRIDKAATFCVNEASKHLKAIATGNGRPIDDRLQKGYLATGKAIGKLSPYCLRSAAAATSIGSQAAKSGIKQQ